MTDCTIFIDSILPKLYGYTLSQSPSCCDNTTTFCSTINNQTRIVGLFMPLFGLNGWIPNELQELNQLQQIVLRNNSLKGPLPIEFGNLKRLEFLELQHNKLSGPIPEQWEGMDLIRDLMIHDNDLTGMIPPGFRNLRNLTQFYVQNNMLKGEMITSTVPNSTYRFTPQRSEPVSILSPVFIPALISSLVAFGVLVVGIYSFYRFRRIKVAEPLEPSVNDTDTDYSDNEEHIYAHDPETGEVHEIDPIDNTELPEPVSIIQNNK